ncbi:uncharacterized protein LOC121235406 [Juglans microcarpa x Juglans regia]|uniref:uncharacterized protein LOC121235406 n=1 Tax=Juglans microcarpa x Juglans regia TaxID=2249226 RepID=UPI001B7E0D65|nr:uncharacterized protein LOC121235406 [Juglans microcarpa x Juglans regia]
MVIQNNSASICNLEAQIGQLSNMLIERTTGTLPSNTMTSSKVHVKAMTLRSGRTYDQPQVVSSERDAEAENVETKMKETEGEMKETDREATDQQGLERIKGMQNPRNPGTLEQMPKCKNFFKDILLNKRKLEEPEIVMLSEESSAILQRKLGLREVKPTIISLQLADRSIKYPRGLIEDVLVKVDKFILPADFIVDDMEEDKEIPLIMGRPFLATGRTLIDV